MNLLETIKTAAIDAVNVTKPVEIVLGIVLSTQPLKIELEQKLSLSEAFVIVPEELTDRTVKIIIDDVEKEIEIKNALQVGDKLALAKIQGGQKYLIISRLVNENVATDRF